MRHALAAVAILQLAITPGLAHRLDEYLQGTLISIESGRVNAQITLAPGVAVLPAVLAGIGTDRDAYARRVLGDIDLSIDGHRLTPQLLSVRFPEAADLNDGMGEIQLEFTAALPAGGRNRKLVLRNHHQSGISVYQVNCTVPSDPAIRIVAQNRNPSQSVYELAYAQSSWITGQMTGQWLLAVPLFLIARFVFAWSKRTKRINGR